MVRFKTTRWSLIDQARTDVGGARPALEQLCRDYRPPVLAFVRRHGYQASDAEDLTQEFFAGFLERGWYAEARPERGRFRTLVLTALRNFMLDVVARQRALKRGGGATHLDIEDATAASDDSPERAFTQAWLGVVFGRARRRLKDECVRSGKGEKFEQLWSCIDGRADSGDIDALAVELGLRRNTLAVQLYRLRGRLRQLIRLELAATVGSREDLELELGDLRSLFEPAGTE